MYDELMEHYEIETGAHSNGAGRSESCLDTTNNNEKPTSIAALEACQTIETANMIYEQEVELLKRGPLE
ncbi:uncharacterized protein EV154DRAFT_565525 [Mucor mucedo]|uniref:uncharacterized protein n=1 Tax=Mucor mucedo TaxID=29922 RepID=UPI00221FA7FE|nr:uncharacterized protein EV154DRAFT_565525 [Mucor mucedo]KAI7889280.1 hypothetical protein EV154DRAFT_565525 [Mucor mucedo]